MDGWNIISKQTPHRKALNLCRTRPAVVINTMKLILSKVEPELSEVLRQLFGQSSDVLFEIINTDINIQFKHFKVSQ